MFHCYFMQGHWIVAPVRAFPNHIVAWTLANVAQLSNICILVNLATCISLAYMYGCIAFVTTVCMYTYINCTTCKYHNLVWKVFGLKVFVHEMFMSNYF